MRVQSAPADAICLIMQKEEAGEGSGSDPEGYVGQRGGGEQGGMAGGVCSARQRRRRVIVIFVD